LEDKNLAATEVVIIGGYLTQVAFRSRFSDISSCFDVELEGPWLLAYPSKVKTAAPSRNKEKLTMMATLQLLSGRNWWNTWITRRAALGIPLGEFPVIPACVDGVWIPRSARLQDYNEGLKLVLMKLGVSRTTTSHSAKALLLTCACHYGLLKDDRKVLGYHRVKEDKSSNAYARELQQNPMEKLAEMLESIRRGMFDPDRPAGERWTTRAGKKVAAPLGSSAAASVASASGFVDPFSEHLVSGNAADGDWAETEIEEALQAALAAPLSESEASECDSALDSELTDDESLAVIAGSLGVSVTRGADGRRFWNMSTGVTHAGRPGEEFLTACGRTVSIAHRLDASCGGAVSCKNCWAQDRSLQLDELDTE
jgi:hypothetical protein